MCTKKTLYAPGIDGHVTLRTREHGGKLNFDQISYTTDCIREVANVWNISILAATRRLRDIKELFQRFIANREEEPHAYPHALWQNSCAVWAK